MSGDHKLSRPCIQVVFHEFDMFPEKQEPLAKRIKEALTAPLGELCTKGLGIPLLFSLTSGRPSGTATSGAVQGLQKTRLSSEQASLGEQQPPEYPPLKQDPLQPAAEAYLSAGYASLRQLVDEASKRQN